MTATALPDVTGYRAELGHRQWQADHVPGFPRPLTGPATVVSASPFPALLVTAGDGRRVTLPLQVLGCD